MESHAFEYRHSLIDVRAASFVALLIGPLKRQLQKPLVSDCSDLEAFVLRAACAIVALSNFD